MMFREGLKCGFHDFRLARDAYRASVGSAAMHRSGQEENSEKVSSERDEADNNTIKSICAYLQIR